MSADSGRTIGKRHVAQCPGVKRAEGRRDLHCFHFETLGVLAIRGIIDDLHGPGPVCLFPKIGPGEVLPLKVGFEDGGLGRVDIREKVLGR